jgi:hypothetical protein
MGRTAAEIIAAVQPAHSSRPPVVWTHRTAKDNLVAMTDDSIVVDTLPREALSEARENLEREMSLASVLGPRPLVIRFMAVQAVQAELNSTNVTIAYDSGGKRLVSRRVTMANADDQAEFVAQARDRMPEGSQVVETSSSRVFHALKPFHLLVLFSMLAAGAHLFFTTDMFVETDCPPTFPFESQPMMPVAAWEAPQWSEEDWADGDWAEEWSDGDWSQPMWSGPEPVEFEQFSGPRHTIVPVFWARSLRRTRIGGLVLLGAAAIAGVLMMIGQTATMGLLLSGVAGSLFWTISRFSNPPRTLAVVVPQRR